MTEESKSQDATQRLEFVNQAIDCFSMSTNILFSDKAHCHLNGHLSKQSCRFWNATNPKCKHPKPLHLAKVTVWAVMSTREIIGPYSFFENARGRAFTVSTETAREMLDWFLVFELQSFLGKEQGYRKLGQRHTRPIRFWPEFVTFSRPDLNSMEFFLCGSHKFKVYVNRLTSSRNSSHHWVHL